MIVKRAEERGRTEEENKHQLYGTACTHNKSLILILKLVGYPALKVAHYFCTSIFSKGTYFGGKDVWKEKWECDIQRILITFSSIHSLIKAWMGQDVQLFIGF